MSINWVSVDVIDPLMDETIIIKKNSVTKLVELDSRHGIEFHVVNLMTDGYTSWSDTK